MKDKKILDKIISLINKSFIRNRNIRQFINNHSIKVEIKDIGYNSDLANIRIAIILHPEPSYKDKKPFEISYLILNLDKKELLTYYYDNSFLTQKDIEYICTQLDFTFNN